MIDFFMMMQPPTTTFQAKKINWKNKAIYESEEAKEARSKLESYLARHAPEKPLTGPLALTAVWLYKTDDDKRVGSPKETKPDLDNMNKLLADSMTKLGFWKDDAQLSRICLEKYWNDLPGIYIKIEEIEDED